MTQAALRLRSGGADHEAKLARAAATGDGRAFATLYDRYEQRVFNLAFLITGSPEHAARATREAFLDVLHALPRLNGGEPRFGSCLLTATRNACHEPIEQRSDGGDVPDPPAGGAEAGTPQERDRDPAYDAEQDQIREASLRLSPPEREALALGRLGELSYGEIAEIMDMLTGSVPALIAGSRIGLHDDLFGTSLASATSSSEECEQALPLIAMRDDGQLSDEDESQWLLDHLAHCGGCRARLDAMQRAGAAYDRWEPVAAPPALFGETVAAAAPAGSAAIDELGAQRSAGPARWGTTGLVCLMLLGLAGIWAGTALVLRSNDRSPRTVSSAADANRLSEGAPARVQRPERRPRVGMTPKAKKVGGAPQDVRIVPQSVVVIGTRPVAERPKATPDKRRRRKGQRRRRTPQAEAVPLKKPTPSPPASQPAPTQPPAGTAPQPQPAPSGCKDPAGNPLPCPG